MNNEIEQGLATPNPLLKVLITNQVPEVYIIGIAAIAQSLRSNSQEYGLISPSSPTRTITFMKK